MNIDMNKAWVAYVKKLNDNHDRSELQYLQVMIQYFADLIGCKSAYLIRVEEGHLNWSSYTLYGQRQVFLELPISIWHQEMIQKPEVKRYENLLVLPVYNHGNLVMILGLYAMEDLPLEACLQMTTMAEVGFQKVDNNKMIHQLKTSERIFRMTFDQAGSGMCQSDLDGKIRFANSKFYEMIGYSETEGQHMSIQALTYAEDLEKDTYFKRQLIDRAIPFYSMEKRYIKKNGDLTWVYVTVSLMEGEDLEEDFLIGVIQDMNAQKQAEALHKNQEKALEKLVKERTHALIDMNKALIEAHKTKDTVIQELKETKKVLEEMAIKDPLTHLYNRRYMMGQLENELERYERYATPFTLIIGDIDHFKGVNDSYGHDCGDFILQEISRDLQESLRKIDVLCRWGGEEFLVLLPETSLKAGGLVAERMRSSVGQKTYNFKETALHVTMTFGVATNVDYKTIEALIKAADDALFVGKDQGRDTVVESQ